MSRHSLDAPKKRPDGSIDTAHYMQIGRRMRSEHALSLMPSIFGRKRKRDR